MILAEASLSFLGLGVPPEVPTWGAMLAESRDQLLANKWWLAVFPGLAIVADGAVASTSSATGCATSSTRASRNAVG